MMIYLLVSQLSVIQYDEFDSAGFWSDWNYLIWLLVLNNGSSNCQSKGMKAAKREKNDNDDENDDNTEEEKTIQLTLFAHRFDATETLFLTT